MYINLTVRTGFSWKINNISSPQIRTKTISKKKSIKWIRIQRKNAVRKGKHINFLLPLIKRKLLYISNGNIVNGNCNRSNRKFHLQRHEYTDLSILIPLSPSGIWNTKYAISLDSLFFIIHILINLFFTHCVSFSFGS